jgi:hypothetical protein
MYLISLPLKEGFNEVCVDKNIRFFTWMEYGGQVAPEFIQMLEKVNLIMQQ